MGVANGRGEKRRKIEYIFKAGCLHHV